MKKMVFFLIALCFFIGKTSSQGCIAIRNISGFGQYLQSDNAFSTSNWLFNVNTRYFKSFRDFKGSKDQQTPAINRSVNHSFSTDITATRLLQNGWSLSVSLPFSVNSREASLEHGGPGTTRHTTHSVGIGDMRVTVYKWLLSPAVSQKFNLQLGVGIKLPTGDYKYQDYFYRNDTTLVLAPVNPSIQLGDGGTGIITELNTFYVITKSISLYGNFYYLINPREQNGTSTTAGRTPTANQIKSRGVETSVADAFALRAGVNFRVHDFIFSAGLREEGVPVHDLAGGSNGTRRAGHNLSFEPGILYKMNKATVYLYVPVIFDRSIRQNVPDKIVSEITGTYTVSQGGFANSLLFAGVLFKL